MTRFALLLCVTALAGCKPATVASVSSSAPKSGAGWQIRYNAALALANRGSIQTKEPVIWDLLQEMLDEERQLRNFTTTTTKGLEQRDETAARTTVVGALKAIGEFHRKQPQVDLADFQPHIEKLIKSANPVVSKEAKQLQLDLTPKAK